MLAEAQRALAPVLGEPESAPVPLEGGITNRNYRLRWGGRDCVLRLPGKDTRLLGIDRTAECAATRAAADAGVGPEVLAFEPGLGCLVTAWIEAAPAEGVRARIPELADLLRRIHAGPELPSRFDSLGVGASYARLVRERGGAVPEAGEALLAVVARIAFGGREHASVPCHNDLLGANILDDGERLWIVDWDYAGMGDRYFDLANLSVNNGFDEADEEALLASYWGGCTPARIAALRLMRVVSDLREGMWGVLQGVISDLDFDFAAYADEHLRRGLDAAADPRFEEWLHAG
jgi:aminoglycoside phosphotransferase (APT) family kinase protein